LTNQTANADVLLAVAKQLVKPESGDGWVENDLHSTQSRVCVVLGNEGLMLAAERWRKSSCLARTRGGAVKLCCAAPSLAIAALLLQPTAAAVSN